MMDLNSLVSVGIGVLVGVIGMAIKERRSRRIRKQNRDMPWREPAKLYHTPSFISSRCLWLIEELGVKDHCIIQPYNPYESSEEERSWYMKNVHPAGKIPSFVVGEHVMTESAAICMYLAETYGDFLPDVGKEKDYYEWSILSVGTMDHLCRILQRQMDYTPEEHQDRPLIAATLEKYACFINMLNDHLQKNEFICGNRFTVADILIGYNVMWISVIKGGLLLRDYEHVSDYLERLKARKAFTPSMGTTRAWYNHKGWQYNAHK